MTKNILLSENFFMSEIEKYLTKEQIQETEFCFEYNMKQVQNPAFTQIPLNPLTDKAMFKGMAFNIAEFQQMYERKSVGLLLFEDLKKVINDDNPQDYMDEHYDQMCSSYFEKVVRHECGHWLSISNMLETKEGVAEYKKMCSLQLEELKNVHKYSVLKNISFFDACNKYGKDVVLEEIGCYLKSYYEGVTLERVGNERVNLHWYDL